MLAVIDHRAPSQAIEKLKSLCGDVFCFNTQDITYNSISGHPDIFIHQDGEGLVIAPNTPVAFIDFLKQHKVVFDYGNNLVGHSLEESTGYNCISTSNTLFHKNGSTDVLIRKRNKDKEFISLPQAYTRCSMIQVGEESFLTSDKGIEKVLIQKGLESFYFDPKEINIVDHKHGFIGGTCGRFEDSIYFIGNIDKHQDGMRLRAFLKDKSLETVCLSDDFLYDGGGLFFI